YRCAVDPELTMVALTDRFEALTGHPARAVIDNAERSYASLVHPDDRQLVRDATSRASETGEPVEIECRLLHADGRELWIRQQAWPVESRETDRPCVEGFLFDVSDRQQAQAERQRAHLRRQRCLLELATHPALIDGRIEELARLATE